MTGRQDRMRQAWRPLMLAAVLGTIAGSGVATAQTVIVRNVPPGSVVELVVNSAMIATATATATGADRGDATLTVPPSAGAKPEMDVFLFAETCENRRRILIVERGSPAAAQEAGCVRREIPGLFLVRAISTLVVDAGGASPTVLLRQGRFNPNAAPRTWRPSPDGLVLFGGGSHSRFSDTGAIACGTGSNCSPDDAGPGLSAGVAYWFLPFLAAEAMYVKPADVSAVGSGGAFTFDSALDSEVLIIAGVAGAPVGPARIYGKGGLVYHRATLSTTETIDDTTYTVNDLVLTVPSGTQTLAFRTGGWGWMFGGGLEAWMTRVFGVYGEFGWAKLKGEDLAGGEGKMDDTLILINFGVRVHVGR